MTTEPAPAASASAAVLLCDPKFALAFCVGAVLLDRLTKQTRPWLV